MKKILLISNYVFHYRINNYNYFYDEFLKLGFEFNVLACEVQKVDFEIKFPLVVEKFSISRYIKSIENLKPVAIINFLHLKDLIIFPLTYYCKLKKIPIIYWNFGINIDTPNAVFKNSLFYHLHNLSDAIILYSPQEKKYIKTKNHHKLFIAYNTLNFNSINKKEFTDTNYIRNKYNIQEKFIVLFVGRITKQKKLDLLLDAFRENQDFAILIVGDGIENDQLNIINQVSNYYYLQGIYDKTELGKIFYGSDVFCITGNLGLSLNEALFWGKPVITLSGIHSPEIYYLKNGYNGYIADDVEDMERKTIELLNDRAKYLEMSENARKTYETEAHISHMFNGFKEAVEFVIKKK